MLNTFRFRNFSLYYIGQAISLVGTSMTQVATAWLVYHLTSSAWLLGLVSFATQIPTFVLIPLGGIVADRWNRHRILIVAQSLGMLKSLTLTWLALTDTINIWHIIVLSSVQGIINAFEIPTRQAFLPETVGRENLGNAIALYSSLVSITTMVGPAIAGVLNAAFGAGICFALDSINYIAVIIALLAMRLAPKKAVISTRKPLEELRVSFIYAFGFLPIRWVAIVAALVCCVWGFYLALGPIFAAEVLHGGSIYDLCLRLSEVTEIEHLAKPLYYYRRHSESASHQKRVEQILAARDAINLALERRGLNERYELDVEIVGRYSLRPKV